MEIPQNVQQAQVKQTPYADGFWQFNQYIVDPKAQDEYSHLIRDIKLSNLDPREKQVCLEILRRIARLKSIGDYSVLLNKKQHFELEEGKTYKGINESQIVVHKGKKYVVMSVPALDDYGEQLTELKNKFPKSLNIYINDLYSIVNVASATDGFERKALTTQITKGQQHFIEETKNRQGGNLFKIFSKKK